MDWYIVGFDIPVVYSIIDVCISHQKGPPDGKTMNPQSRPAVMLCPLLSCVTEQPLGTFEAMGLQGLMSSHQRIIRWVQILPLPLTSCIALSK